jgi:hypothetical protein
LEAGATGLGTALAGTAFPVACTTGFLVAGAAFFTTGLTVFLPATGFLAPLGADTWAGLEADFLGGAAFFTLIGFLAGFAAFFLDAIRLGFFCNKHF